MFNINKFKSHLKKGGMRGNRFRATLDFPKGIEVDGIVRERFIFLAQSATLPGSSINVVDAPFQGGRVVPVPGARNKFEPITLTTLSDHDSVLRDAILKYHSLIHQHEGNTGVYELKDYEIDLKLELLDKADQPIKEYTLVGAWPSDVSEISLDVTDDGIKTFDVTWEYSYFADKDPSVTDGQ